MKQELESEKHTNKMLNVIRFLEALGLRNRRNEYKKKNWSHAKWIWQICKARSKRLNIEFNISIEDVEVPEFCPVLGLKLKINTRTGKNDDSATIDRLNPRLGYIKGNVAVISHLANRIKSNATTKQIKLVYEWLNKKKIK